MIGRRRVALSTVGRDAHPLRSLLQAVADEHVGGVIGVARDEVFPALRNAT